MTNPQLTNPQRSLQPDLHELSAPRPRLTPPGTPVDPVAAEVLRSAMETICFEMAVFVSRTATTPILNQSNERNASILDRNGRLAAVSVGIPQLMLASSLPVRYALEFFGDDIHEGDVFLANDPFCGGGHLPDYNVFAPVFVDGRHVLTASIQCHHGDTGGSVPGGYNISVDDIWGEGVRFPVLKVVDRGVERYDVLHALAANNRQPGHLGDLRAQIGSAQLGAQRLAEEIGRRGDVDTEAAIDWFIDSTAARFKEEVTAWPDGVYEADAFADHDPIGTKDIKIHVKITVDGENLGVDFTGTDDRPTLLAWSSFGNTRAFTISQIAAMLPADIPHNEGFFENVRLHIPYGCVLNPRYGRPVSAGTHHPGTEVGDAIALALSHALPERAVPQTYKTGIPTVVRGVDPRTGVAFTDHSAEVYAGWCNAAEGVDGWGAFNAAFGNLWKATAEINEVLFPHVQWARDYRTDSGGPGQYRGGCGSHYEKEVCVDSSVYTYVVGLKYPMPGVRGGEPGTPNQLVLRGNTDDPVLITHTADNVPMKAGDRIVFDYGGGGGWGDPLERDPQAVLDDVLDEYVSIEGARRDYGVVLSGSVEALDVEVDKDATVALREQLAARRSPAV